jgi:TP53 regulating kinase-like protein
MEFSKINTQKELIKQGAEAKVYKIQWKEDWIVEKERIAKPWRHPVLDQKLRKQRLKQEMNSLVKAHQGGISVPKVVHVDRNNSSLYLEFISGSTLRSILESNIWSLDRIRERLYSLGSTLANLHDLGIIHEDLTTSNIMVRSGTEDLVLIDFGLSHVSMSIEDKAVDLYVLERTFISTHPLLESELIHVCKGYQETSSKGETIMKKLLDVRARGRKRTMLG